MPSTARPSCKRLSASRLPTRVLAASRVKMPLHKAFVAQRMEELTSRIAEGGPREAAIRALLYVRMPEGVVDERGFNLLRRIRDEAGSGLTLSAFKKLVREQFLMLLLDERRAVEAIPAMLEKDPKLASRMADNLHRVIDAVGLRSEVGRTLDWPRSRRFSKPERLTHQDRLSTERLIWPASGTCDLIRREAPKH